MEYAMDNLHKFITDNLFEAEDQYIHESYLDATMVVASMAEEKHGIGNLIKFPIEELKKLYRNRDSELWIEVETTEGQKEFQIHDFLLIDARTI